MRRGVITSLLLIFTTVKMRGLNKPTLLLLSFILIIKCYHGAYLHVFMQHVAYEKYGTLSICVDLCRIVLL